MNYLFTSESVSEGHPDKVADQISDAVLDQFLAQDPNSKVACETLVTTGQVVIAGEVKSDAYIDLGATAREVINSIGYNRSELKFDGESCGIFSALHEQSSDINRGVERAVSDEQGAGDQGMMFGFATDETPLYIPLTAALSHALLKELSRIRREGKEFTYTDPLGQTRCYLRPDSKSQVTVEYDEENRPVRVHTIVISTQHDDFILPSVDKTQEEADREMIERITRDVREILIPRTKAALPEVDRSAAYAARHIAKNLVAAGVCREALVQVAYAIGVARPVSLYVNTHGTARVPFTDAEISAKVSEIFDMRPAAIERRLKLRNPIYLETATYGHVGRTPRTVTKTFRDSNGHTFTRDVDLFTWEALDYIAPLRAAFSLD